MCVCVCVCVSDVRYGRVSSVQYSIQALVTVYSCYRAGIRNSGVSAESGSTVQHTPPGPP